MEQRLEHGLITEEEAYAMLDDWAAEQDLR
jgi:hypothetical protein